MEALLALVGFSAVSSVTPGPNNLLLWASGTTFGFRRTIRHVLGTSLGIGAMAIGVAAGLGALIASNPEVAFAMKLGGSAYLLFLAGRLAGSRGVARGSIARPLGLLEAAAFQVINPKAWVFAVGAITTFRPPDLPVSLGTVVVAVAMMLVILPTAALWAGGGGVLGRFLVDDRTSRRVNRVLALVLAATVATVWA